MDECFEIDIFVKSPWGDTRCGHYAVRHHLVPNGWSVSLRFDPPLSLGFPIMGMLSKQEDFYVESGERCVWGQGREDPVNDWVIEERSREKLKAADLRVAAGRRP